MKLKLIIAGRGDGLGARFKNIIATKILAEHLNISYLISWCNISSHCSCNIEELIESGVDYVNVTSKMPNIKDPILIEYVKEKYNIDLQTCLTLNPGKKPIKLNSELMNNIDVLLLYSNGFYTIDDPEYTNINNKMIISYTKFVMNQYVQKVIDKYKITFRKYKIIGIHIRRGECVNKPSVKIASRGNVSVNSVYQLLDTKVFDNDKFRYFICSDDQLVIDTINERYQRPLLKQGVPIKNCGKTFYYPCRSLNRTDPVAIQDAWIIMNLMRKCYMIICSHSLFNKVPCFVSNTKRCVIRPNNMNKTLKEFYNAIKN